MSEVSTVEIPTVDLGSEEEALRRCRTLSDLGMNGVESARVEGSKVILTVRTEFAQNIHGTLYAAGLRPWQSASCFGVKR